MKKLIKKNCIAFTIMEMTLVLLITSVIAAASTPILTSAVSDYADKNYSASDVEAADAPWRKASGYDGGGIFNSPIENTSPVSINAKFGSAASNYGYPALVVESQSTNNLFNSPQIQVIPPNSSAYANFAMDEFQNISLTTHGASYRNMKVGAGSTNTTYIGNNNVFMGYAIQSSASVAATDMYYKNSLMIGQEVNSKMLENVILVGNKITRNYPERNTIIIGQNLSSAAYDSVYQGGIRIGSYSKDDISVNSISIGNYAAKDSSFTNNISIGSYAADNSGHMIRALVGQYSSLTLGNVYIGKYAGAHYFGTTTGVFGRGDWNNIMIGGYAGYTSTGYNSGRTRDYNVFIGESAGRSSISGTSSKIYASVYNVKIGHCAGFLTQPGGSDQNNINIGYYAGTDDTGFNSFYGRDNIFIGSYAARSNNNLIRSIVIGSSKETSLATGYYMGNGYNVAFAQDLIAIGPYAGTANSNGMYGSMYIGKYAGYFPGSSSTGLYGNVCIGPRTCMNMPGMNKWHLGWGGNIISGGYAITSAGTSKTPTGTQYWNPGNAVPQMFIGYANGYSTSSTAAYSSTAITLYANSVYRPSGTTFDIFKYSDKRLKTNIVPVKDSLANLRKIGIYDYNMKDDDKKTPRIGVIAQEYKKVFPQEVKIEPNTKYYAVGSDWLVYSMVDAIKELDKNIQNIQTKFNAYVKDFMGLKSRVARLEMQAQEAKRQNAIIKSRLAKINAKLN